MGKREHIYEIIAENIRKERRRLGITQAELAERADVSLDTIKSVENGRRAMSLDTYLNIVHSSQNIWRMKQFYETYKDKPELSKLLRENTWSNNLHIISKTKSYEEKEFYLKLASKEKYKAKELARQIDSGYYERLLLSNGKAPSAIESKDMTGVLRDMYMLEFLQ